jgi:hypothetical protein
MTNSIDSSLIDTLQQLLSESWGRLFVEGSDAPGSWARFPTATPSANDPKFDPKLDNGPVFHLPGAKTCANCATLGSVGRSLCQLINARPSLRNPHGDCVSGGSPSQ